MTLKKLRILLFGHTTSERIAIMTEANRVGRETTRRLHNQMIQIGLDHPVVHCDGRINEEETQRRNARLIAQMR